MQRQLSRAQRVGLRTPIRNRYFYGKMLDVYHFELETDYFNGKRWLLNRLVTGYGVVCGLNVEAGPENTQIVVSPGVAIDKWGREIIVARPSDPIPIIGHVIRQAVQQPEQSEQQQSEEQDSGQKSGQRREAWLHVAICYHECDSEPTPVLAGDCHTTELCTPGMIREQYRIEFRRGRARRPQPQCRLPDVFSGDRVDYAALARLVTQPCPDLPDDPCILLANIRISSEQDGHQCNPDNVDITIRPVVYSNDLLFELLLALAREEFDDDYRERKG